MEWKYLFKICLMWDKLGESTEQVDEVAGLSIFDLLGD
jgi:hypothetical protein